MHGGKEEAGRIVLLEQQLKVEREKNERMEQHYVQERERLVKEHAREQQAAKEEAARMLEQIGMETEVEDKTDVYELDVDMIRAGPYYTSGQPGQGPWRTRWCWGMGEMRRERKLPSTSRGRGDWLV